MPIVPNIPITANPDMNIGTDIAGNPLTGSGFTGSGNNSTPVLTAPAQETGETNPTPMLITPEIEVPHRPLGSGASIIVEPDLGRPINSIPQLVVEPILEEKPTKNAIQNLINILPPFLGGGGGGGATDDSEKNAPKKTNYVLYGGIIIALIIANKILSKKKK